MSFSVLILSKSVYFEQALTGFETHGFYNPEICRTKYKIAKFKLAEGDMAGGEQLMAAAERMYAELVSSYRRGDTLTERDFDNLVFLHSR